MFPGEWSRSELLRDLSEGVIEEEEVRRKLGKIEVLRPISEISDPVKTTLRTVIRVERLRMKGYVSVFREIDPRINSEFTPALFSAYYLDTKSRILKQMARDLVAKGQFKGAAIVLDMKQGYEIVLAVVSIEELLKSQNSPNGYAIVDWEINKLKEVAYKKEELEGLLIRPWQNPQLVIAGAEVAQELYKEFYPRAAGILRAHTFRRKKR